MVAEFAERAHRVVGCSRSKASVDRLGIEYPSPHRFDVVDVANGQQVRSWAESVLESHGPPCLLLNNAGIINRNANLWEVPADQFSKVVDVNIKGTYHAIRHFLPAMIQQGKGVIVNFSSGWGRSAAPEVAPYCATKWAVEGMTRALSQELPSGMAAVALNPGIIHTEMLESCFGASASSFPSPQTWASQAVPFLLSLSARHNGEALTAPQ